MSLQTVLEEIKKVKPFAEEDTNSGAPETLNARRGRKNQAVESLKRLKREYKQDLIRTAVFIVATGSGREEFTKIASEEPFNLFSADPEEFYKDLSDRIPQVLYLNKQGVLNVFDVLGRHLEDKMNELDITEYNQIIFKGSYSGSINSTEQFTALVKNVINEQIGSEIAGIQAINSLVNVAIEKNHSATVTPIVLSTGDEKLAISLLKDLERISSKVFLSVTGKSSKTLKSIDNALVLKEANTSTVKQALDQMRKSLKK